ncbi:hypothetical protein PanWU01x14_246850, partial [Parasponia andersonii]
MGGPAHSGLRRNSGRSGMGIEAGQAGSACKAFLKTRPGSSQDQSSGPGRAKFGPNLVRS